MSFINITRKKTTRLYLSEEINHVRVDFKNLFFNLFKKTSVIRFSTKGIINFRKRKISNRIISKSKFFEFGNQVRFLMVISDFVDRYFKNKKNVNILKILTFKETVNFNIYQNLLMQSYFNAEYETNKSDYFINSGKIRVIIFQDSNNKRIRKNRLNLTQIFKKRLLWSTFSFLTKRRFKKKFIILSRQRSFLELHRPDLLFCS
jgi:hypothetical protein